MATFAKSLDPRSTQPSQWRVRPALIVALLLSLVLHLVWSLWPVEPAPVREEPVLTATLREMPPPPTPLPAMATPLPSPTLEQMPSVPVRRLQKAGKAAHVIAAPVPSDISAAADSSAQTIATVPAQSEAVSPPNVVIGPPASDAKPPVELPPRVDLAYKVFFGTQGFMIGDATYRFEHDGNRYRISTVAQARGLAALFVHGKGRVESRGTITPQGLKPYEFVVERGNADRREVAYFDWDAGNVVLNGGNLTTLEPPAFDPLTILWQPYFSPPSRDDQTFTLATTRRVARYTLSLEGEEALPWREGDIATQRWHERSDDGRTEGWFWLAPSLHYIPIKMRVTRTSRGTLEARLDAIRTDANGAEIAEPQANEQREVQPANPMLPEPGGPESHGQ
ncbi:MAG TPA: DUF3108 domain-containing protein [Casimicrobiaceae bacterium]|nr:DUF3108 domain-containing protein [Casimicrobiaceae bacterium]